jgi:hypothetical protein
MKKKTVVVGLLAGSIALTGLGGAAYADGGAFGGPLKPLGPGGRYTAVTCIKKAGPGKPGAPGVSGKKVFKTNGDLKVLPVPPAGAKVGQPGAGGVTTAFPPPGDKAPEDTVKIVFNDAGHPLKGDPGAKGVQCFQVPGGPGARLPGGEKPPLPPIVEPTPTR